MLERLSPDVMVAYSGKETGNMAFSKNLGSMAEVAERRAKLYSKIGLVTEQVTWIVPDGGVDITDVDITPPTADRSYVTDALITREADHGLALFPADCIPIVVRSTREPLLALIHVGRPGAEQDMHTKAINVLAENYAPLDSLRLRMGPSVHQDNLLYEYLGGQLAESEWEDFVEQRDKLWHIDLIGFVYNGLVRAGLRPDQISRPAHDTGNGQFFSHSRANRFGEPDGRNGVVTVRRAA